MLYFVPILALISFFMPPLSYLLISEVFCLIQNNICNIFILSVCFCSTSNCFWLHLPLFHYFLKAIVKLSKLLYCGNYIFETIPIAKLFVICFNLTYPTILIISLFFTVIPRVVSSSLSKFLFSPLIMLLLLSSSSCFNNVVIKLLMTF